MNKKIAFITEEFTDGDFSSGGLKLDFMLLSKLITLGYEIHVFANRYHKKLETEGMVAHAFEDFNNSSDFSFVLVSKGCYKGDITYLHDHTNTFRFKHLYSRYAQIFNTIFNRKHLKKRQEYDKLIQQNLEDTKKIIVSSNILADDYAQNFNINRDRFIILPPPIVTQQLTPSIKEPEHIFTFGLSAVGFERKGGYIALNAAAQLKKKYKNFKIVIIYSKVNFLIKTLLCLKGISKHVEFIPCQKDMGKFYNNIDALLMPSKVEPFGMVASEAMSYGKPVIVSNISGAVDILEEGKNGYIVNSERNFAKNLYKAMKKMLDMPLNEYELMSQNAYKSVQTLDISAFTQKYIDLMESIKNKI